jgi:prepilin-type N-terminal cleavage/methylation domain-containing protein
VPVNFWETFFKRKGEEPIMCKRKGFTLIELLVVIAIIALLMAILMPALQRVKKQAKTVICQAHLKEWATLFAMYTDDNNGYFPERRSGSSGYGRWMDSMREYYISAPDIRLCPMAKKLANPSMATTGVDWWGSTFKGWGMIPTWDAGGGRTAGYYGSYGVNGYIYVPIGADVYGKPPERFWRTANVKGANNIPMFMDCYFWCGWPDDTNTPPEYDGWQNRSDADAINRFCINRHDGFIGTAFVDYSVRRVGLKELFTLKWSRVYNTANAWTTAGGITPADWKHHGNGWMARFKDY